MAQESAAGSTCFDGRVGFEGTDELGGARDAEAPFREAGAGLGPHGAVVAGVVEEEATALQRVEEIPVETQQAARAGGRTKGPASWTVEPTRQDEPEAWFINTTHLVGRLGRAVHAMDDAGESYLVFPNARLMNITVRGGGGDYAPGWAAPGRCYLGAAERGAKRRRGPLIGGGPRRQPQRGGKRRSTRRWPKRSSTTLTC